MTNRLTKYWKLHKYPILMAILSLVFYQTFAYHLERTDFVKLFTLFAALFFLCQKLIQFEKWNLRFLVAIGILFRLVFFFALPHLSQDYPFIWAGRQAAHGPDPYLLTSYPPLNQLIFSLEAPLGDKSIWGPVIAMRTVIIFADVGILYFGRKLLQRLNRPTHLIFWYFLNPLVITELTGNLHFEGVMLFFLVWSLFLFVQGRWKSGALVYALSIAVEMIPLMFLPLFAFYFGWKKCLKFYLLIGISLILLLLPPQSIAHYSGAIGPWFINSEFNAGLFNVVKKIALHFDVPRDGLIGAYEKIVPYIMILWVLLLTFLRKNRAFPILLSSMMWILLGYYCLATTVHPWYIVPLLLLSLFTGYRFPIVWSVVVVFGYYAYGNPNLKENLALLFIEYILVYGFLIYELFKFKRSAFRFFKN